MGTPAWQTRSKCIIPAAHLVAGRCVKNNIWAHFGGCAGGEEMGHFSCRDSPGGSHIWFHVFSDGRGWINDSKRQSLLIDIKFPHICKKNCFCVCSYGFRDITKMPVVQIIQNYAIKYIILYISLLFKYYISGIA